MTPLNVLVIEDHPTDRKLACVVLKMKGHAVREAITAEAAIGAIEEQLPDVILLDLKLPGIDGLAFVRQLKANAKTRHVPIVAVTAFSDRYRRDDLLAAGCDAFIVKPIDTRELPDTLAAVVEKKNS